MHVVLKCPCGASLKAPTKYVGKQIKCPKCATMLIVPAPPVAATPVNPEIEVLSSGDDPLMDPLSDPLAAPPVAPLPTRKPPARKPARKVSAKNKKPLNWILIGSCLAASLLVFGGILFYFYQVSSTESTANLGAIRRGGKSIDVSKIERPTSFSYGPEAEPNSYDSGKDKIRIASVIGSDSDLSLPQLIERVEPSIVRIKVVGKNGEESVGSGFFIDTEGKIATNAHVVRDAKTVNIETSDGKKTKAIGVVAKEKEKDIAIIQIDPDSLSIKPLPIAKDLPNKGDAVAAFGSPQGFGFTSTAGVVSSIRKGGEIKQVFKEMTNQDVFRQLGYDTDTNWIQFTASISGGNSGGPLVNMRGEMVGINTWTHPGGQNLNFASALHELEQVFENRDGDLYPYEEE